MEMSYINETEKTPQTISFPCSLSLSFFFPFPFDPWNQWNNSFWLWWELILKQQQQQHMLLQWLRITLEVTMPHWCSCTDQRGIMLTAHPASPLAPAQHRYWSTAMHRHRCCSKWPGKNIPEGNCTGAAKLLLASLSWLCCLVNPSNFFTWKPDPHQISLCL